MARAKIRFKIVSECANDNGFEWKFERTEEYKKLEQAQEVLQELANAEVGQVVFGDNEFTNKLTGTHTYIKKINLSQKTL